jgi:hypothetical protein
VEGTFARVATRHTAAGRLAPPRLSDYRFRTMVERLVPDQSLQVLIVLALVDPLHVLTLMPPCSGFQWLSPPESARETPIYAPQDGGGHPSWKVLRGVRTVIGLGDSAPDGRLHRRLAVP